MGYESLLITLNLITLPLTMTPQEISRYVSDGFVRAKAGEALAVYASVAPIHTSGALPPERHYSLGWIIYYALHQSAPGDILPRKRMLAHYLGLRTPRPHKLHSMILTEAIRLYRDARDSAVAARLKGIPHDAARDFSLVKFMRLWDFRHLRPGDWRRKQHEGKPMSATVEKLITHYVDELEGSHAASAPSAEFMDVMERAMREYPATASLLARRATLYQLSGETERCAPLLRQAVMVAPGKFYLWQRLAAYVDPVEHPKLHISLLFRALSAPGQDSFKGKVRLALADAWLRIGRPHFAAWEIDRVKQVYEANGWHLPPRHRELEERLPHGTIAADPAGAYRSVAHEADELLYESLPPVRVSKTYHKPAVAGTDRYGRQRPGMVAWRVTDAAGVNYWFNPGRHRLQEDLPHGTRLIVKIHEGKIVKAMLDTVPDR